ncbi:MAG TPA: hypothetical protein VMV81_03620 [Phycisphaerae bacterium]|nr:hypothetical protein [Phycisphaerae bacterium]
MNSSLRYPMNPTDYVLLATHESLLRRGYCGLNVMLLIEAEGDLPAQSMRQAAARLGELYPALSAHICYSRLTHRPAWRISADGNPEEAVRYTYQRSESGNDNWEAQQQALDEAVEVRRGPQLHLTHTQLGERSHQLGLTWPHHLMDMEGGHLILRSIDDLLNGRDPALRRDPRATSGPPFSLGLAARLAQAWHGRWIYATYDSYRQPRIVKKPENAPRWCRFVVRTYDTARRQRFKELAASRVSPGPLRDSRATIIGLARAYRKMAEERGRPREHYLFPMPLPLPRAQSRPGIHGNYVTIPFVIFASEDLEDWAPADAVASKQLREYHEKGRDVAMWCMYRAASRWPLGLTSLLTTHRRPRTAAGYTGYQFDDSVTTLGTARITNLTGAGSMDCHPGWMLGRTTFGDSMSLSITYFEDYFDGPSVGRFFDLLEKELFEE